MSLQREQNHSKYWQIFLKSKSIQINKLHLNLKCLALMDAEWDVNEFYDFFFSHIKCNVKKKKLKMASIYAEN